MYGRRLEIQLGAGVGLDTDKGRDLRTVAAGINTRFEEPLSRRELGRSVTERLV